MIQSAQPPPTDLVLTAMLNEIAVVPGDFILILDDYHAIGAKAIDAALSFLIEHLPPQMHLVMATREDPNLPLSRLRAGGLLTELRAREYYEKPTAERKRKLAAAIKRHHKRLRSQLLPPKMY